MNRSVHRGATFAAATWILLVVAALVASGCGGSNGSEALVGDGGDDGSGDAIADGTQGGDGPTSADSGSDRTTPGDGGHDATDAPIDHSMDHATGDAPADQSTDSTGMDAPADVVTGCNSTTCPTGCCSGGTCTTPSTTACGTAGAACVSCGATADGCSASGACTCGGATACAKGQVCANGSCICDANSCSTGCCQGNTCQPGTDPNACGAAGSTCAMCPTGQTCNGGACSGCNSTSCPDGCCSGNTCNDPTSAMACGSAGASCTNCGATADGCSASGTCTCNGAAACGAGQECSGGKCVCDANSCPTGCCQNNTCTKPSSMACGTGGGSCTDCGTTGDGCSATGACTCGGAKACGSGQECSGGKCVCDATSCPTGCCLNNTCDPGDTTAACGPAGGTCQVCATGDSCTNNKCVAPPPVCGDGIRETGEQCDDGNLVDLDGCDATCKFEQLTRATTLSIQWAHDTFCTTDVLFEAVKDPLFANVHSTLQGDLNTAVTNGSDNVILEYFSITDLTGQNGTASVGSYNALATTYTGAFTGNADLDWWYSLDTTTAGASPLFTPTVKQSTGTFTAGVLNATGGHVLVSAFGTSLFDLANVKLQLPIAKTATKPTASTGAAPGHLASENLDPTLTSFPTAGGTNAAPTGLLCGDTTAASLAATVVPAQLQSNCTQGFTAANNMLDVFIDGCTANIVGTIIAKQQPDHINPDAPAAGAGGPYTFQLTGNSVTGCKDKNGMAVTPYTACLGPAAYSSYLKMAMDRVILKHP